MFKIKIKLEIGSPKIDLCIDDSSSDTSPKINSCLEAPIFDAFVVPAIQEKCEFVNLESPRKNLNHHLSYFGIHYLFLINVEY